MTGQEWLWWEWAGVRRQELITWADLDEPMISGNVWSGNM